MSNSSKDTVKIADFKAHLSEYLRNVRNGHPLTLMDRHTPVARIVPYSEKLVIRHATRRPDQVKLKSRPLKNIDFMKYLAEERQSWR